MSSTKYFINLNSERRDECIYCTMIILFPKYEENIFCSIVDENVVQYNNYTI